MFPGKALGSNLQEGVHSRSFPQAALRADLVYPPYLCSKYNKYDVNRIRAMQNRISYSYNLFWIRVCDYFFILLFLFYKHRIFCRICMVAKRNFKMIRFGSIIIFRYVSDTSNLSETLNGLTSNTIPKAIKLFNQIDFLFTLSFKV